MVSIEETEVLIDGGSRNISSYSKSCRGSSIGIASEPPFLALVQTLAPVCVWMCVCVRVCVCVSVRVCVFL